MMLALLARAAVACSCTETEICGDLFWRGEMLASNDVIAMLPLSGSCPGGGAEVLEEAALFQGEEPVPVDVTSDNAGVYRLIPAGGWVAGADYALQIGFEDALEFSVEEAADEEAPPTPKLEGATREIATQREEEYYGCGGWDFIDVTLGNSPEEPVYYEIDLGDPQALAMEAWGYNGELTLEIGYVGCDASIYLKDKPYNLKIRAIDAAGNASEWSESVTVEAPPPSGKEGCGGCAAGEGATGAGGLLALAVLLVRRREGSLRG